MRQIFPSLWSTVGQKFLIALTGLGLCGYVTFHLLANLQLILTDSTSYNRFAHSLVQFGWLLIVAELGLAAVFLFHIYTGIAITLKNRAARPIGYKKVASAGMPSKKSIGSATMIWAGLVLLAFLIMHLVQFKFTHGETILIEGKSVRNLYGVVANVFQNEWLVLVYVVALGFLGFHLSHGFWSAFQSLGVNQARFTNGLYRIGFVFAIFISVGFIIIPIWIYLMVK